MKLLSCEIARFGFFRSKTIEFCDRITVVRGKNESGKSTLSGFIKYILYGYTGKGRDEKGNEKLRFSPRDGTESAGALVVESSDGERFRIERRGDGKTGEAKVLNSLGARCFDGTEPGTALYGVDAVTFSKSVFVGQNDIEGSGMRGIGASLERLLLDAEGENDFDTARRNLVGERNVLCNKMRNTGLILELAGRLEELKARREKEAESNTRLVAARHLASETQHRIEENRVHLERLYAEAENIAAYEAHERLNKIRTARRKTEQSLAACEEALSSAERNGMLPDRQYIEDLESAYAEFVSAEPEYMKAEQELGAAGARCSRVLDGLLPGSGFENLAEEGAGEVHRVYKAAAELHRKARIFRNAAVVLLCLIVTMPVSVVFFILSARKKKALSALLSQYGFKSFDTFSSFDAEIDGVFESIQKHSDELVLKRSQAESSREKVDGARCKLSGLLSLIGMDFGDSDTVKDTVLKLLPSLKYAISEVERTNAGYASDKTELEVLLSVSSIMELEEAEKKMQPSPPERRREDVEFAIKYDEGANRMLEKRLSDLTAEIAALEASNADPASLEAEISSTSLELSSAKEKLDAIELAIDLIDQARDGICGGVLPRVSEIAGKLFARFTDGKYRNLFFDKDGGLKVLAEGDTETRSVASLSAGASDAAYIALRIALARVLFREKPVFVFDDSFVKCDDERLGRILDVLTVLSSEYQIIILTCHTREERYLAGKCRTVILDEQ